MTQEHEEAVMLAQTVGGVHVDGSETLTIHKPCKMLVMTPEQLAALIADVRRQAVEEAIAACDRTASQFYENNLSMFGDGAQAAGDAIRARLEEEK